MLTPIVDFFTKTQVDLPLVPASLFYSKDGYSVGDLKLDLLLSEDHALVANVSSHPIEDGSVISDHIQNELQAGSLRGLVSNHSIQSVWPVNDQSTRLEDIIKKRSQGLVQNKSKAAWDELRRIMEKQELVTIVLGLQTYTDVAITNVAAFRDSSTGEALDFTLSFQQVKRVKLKQVSISAQIQPGDMDSDINRKSAVAINDGQTVPNKSAISVNTIKVKG